MTVRAILERNGAFAEKRTAARTTLRLATSGTRARRGTAEVLIHDISAGGMLIESAEAFEPDEEIAVDLPQYGVHEAVVVWSSGRFYGCRFAEPLPAPAISAALLKSSPSEPQAARRPKRQKVAANFPARLTALREERGLSMEQFAKRLGISRQALWYWETGQRVPRSYRLSEMAKVLDVDERELFGSAIGSPEAEDSLLKCRVMTAARFGVGLDQVKIVIEL
jgi:transcriptional regulator with XRE-family HTH domain